MEHYYPIADEIVLSFTHLLKSMDDQSRFETIAAL